MSEGGQNEIFDKIAAVPVIPRSKRGVKHYAACPCGGVIMAWRCKESGKLRAICSKCRWRLVE